MGFLVWASVITLLGTVLSLEISQEYLEHVGRSRRAVDNTNRPTCETSPDLSIRVDTRNRVDDLRREMSIENIDAYIIPSHDAHHSEYPSRYDYRREFISGFSGSAGTAVVTQDKAALWTDGRYFLQADQQLDCHNWILMRSGMTNVPTITEWLLEELDGSENKSVGVYPFVFSSKNWKSYMTAFKGSSVFLQKVQFELIDEIWTSGRPPQPNTAVNALDATKFAGKRWEDKIADIRHSMQDKMVDVLVVTKLDEIAWMFNLRASDIDYNPFLISYSIVEKNKIRLCIRTATLPWRHHRTAPTETSYPNTTFTGSRRSQFFTGIPLKSTPCNVSLSKK